MKEEFWGYREEKVKRGVKGQPVRLTPVIYRDLASTPAH
jgi:hypothetical protein